MAKSDIEKRLARLPLELRTPIKAPAPERRANVSRIIEPKLALQDVESIASTCNMYQQKVQEKLSLLFDYYQVSQTDLANPWATLALRLATDLLPGFQLQFVEKAGAKRLWNTLMLARLFFEIEQHIATQEARGTTCSVNMACRSLARSTYWKEKLRSGQSRTVKNLGDILEKRHVEAKQNAFVNVLLEMRDNSGQTEDAQKTIDAILAK